MNTNNAVKTGLPQMQSKDTAERKTGLVQVATSMTMTLKRIAKDIKIMSRVCKVFRQRLKGLTEFQILRPTGQVKDSVLVEDRNRMIFDPTLFKTGQNHFPRKAELITLKRPEWRTEVETKFLWSILQNLPSYRQYSNQLQMLLAKVLRLERFGRRRVIIKKGHTGSSFYFIYSGCVAICNDREGSSAFLDKDPALLHAGSKFGDIALLKGQRRNATVVCMEETVILVVDKEDFFSNKLDVELQKECQCRFEYFRSLDIFSHWPHQHIKSISESCQTMQYQFGQLIILDSSESNSIAFITEGTCDVLRLVNLTMCPSYHKWLQLSLPSLKATTALQPKSIYEKPTCQQSLPIQKRVPAHKWKCLTDNLVAKSYRDNVANSIPEGLHSVVAAAVYIHIDLLHQKEFFNLSQDFQENLKQGSQRDNRGLILVSRNCKIILLKMSRFKEFCDPETIEKLQKYQKKYPSDNTLCKLFLQQNDWEMFKKDLVSLLLKPLTTYQCEKKQTKKQIQLQSSSSSREGILDLCSVSLTKPRSKYVTRGTVSDTTAQSEHLISPQNGNVRLIHAITVPRPKLDWGE
ncbi:cyclic nucleotide-binding domain-containing protein 2-like [Rhinoderma darwinii]|uniref:cyclic nucleotide-binding domain-containing protein 2-like n=1 Tax=Rhinoderma darwinii TaxID=43563 RepID=UPI003F67269B